MQSSVYWCHTVDITSVHRRCGVRRSFPPNYAGFLSEHQGHMFSQGNGALRPSHYVSNIFLAFCQSVSGVRTKYDDVRNGMKVKIASEHAIHDEPRLTEVSLTAGVVVEVATQCPRPHSKSSAGWTTASTTPPCRRISRKAQYDTG